MTTPEINLDINLVKGESKTYRRAIQAAFDGRLAEGDPLAASYDHATWSSDQTHHLIAEKVINNDLVLKEFFANLRTATIGAPGGAYVFDINNPNNLVNLPTTNDVRSGNTTLSAALHNGNSAEHQAFDAFTRKVLHEIVDQYTIAERNLGQPNQPVDSPEARQALALKAAAQVEDFQRTLRAGLYGETASEIKYFVNINDEILIARYADQGYANKSPEDRRIFLEQNVYNADPKTIVSQGDVLTQTLSDGRSQIRPLTTDAMNTLLADSAGKSSINGVLHEDFVRLKFDLIANSAQTPEAIKAVEKAILNYNNVKSAEFADKLTYSINIDPPERYHEAKMAQDMVIGYNQERFDIAKALGDVIEMARTSEALKKANAAGLIMGFMGMTADALAAIRDGDSKRALEIFKEGFIGFAAGALIFGGLEAFGALLVAAGSPLIGGLILAAVPVYGVLETIKMIPHFVDSIANLFTSATVATPPVRRDPLVFDLDGDGLETAGVNTANPIYFDHDADGVKTATGWVESDDAFLVLDKNANGTIDSGRELFGDAMLKSNGQLAADGFDALRDLDANLDGKVDAADAQFANLRLWRDLNQDGISQANELFTLGSQNIAAINVGSTEHSQILANGNQLADIGSYVKTDGSVATLGEVTGHLGDINLIQDTFHSQFTDHLDTTGFEALPDMHGAGQVRNLREAATLSPALAQLLADFAAADRTGQQALLDTILKAWSETSTMAATFTGAYAGHSLTVNIQNIAAGSAAYNAWVDKLTILEHFNGRTFNTVPAGTTAATINLWSVTQDLLQSSYDALKNSVYQSLVLQTRVQPLLDLISLRVDENGVALDFTEVNAEFDRRAAINPGKAAADLAEFTIMTQDSLKDSGWRGWEKLVEYVNTYPMTPEMRSELVLAGVKFDGTGGNDTVVGDAGNNNISGGAGNDTIYGANGDDTL
ncbi:hypothetical protein NP603_19115, partial [Methylomonas sp. SURF-1]|nr:hypothetical protein [Methylomonas sp. SURF-1]